jgi:hypothetical protein
MRAPEQHEDSRLVRPCAYRPAAPVDELDFHAFTLPRDQVPVSP